MDIKRAVENSINNSGTSISVDSNGYFTVNSIKIPYSLYAWFFEQFGSPGSSLGLSKSTVKEIAIGSDTYSLVKNLNGAYDLRKNGQLHCKVGPAKVTSSGVKYYLQEGVMHRLDGPAKEGVDISQSNLAKIYAINGKFYSLKEFVKNHPQTKIDYIIHNNKSVITYENEEFLLIVCSEAEFFLKKNDDGSFIPPSQFMLPSFYRFESGYDVLSFSSKYSALNDLFKLTKDLTTWDFYETEGFLGLEGTFEKEGREHLLICSRNEKHNSISFDVYDENNHKISSRYIPLNSKADQQNTDPLAEITELLGQKEHYMVNRKKQSDDIQDLLEDLGAVFENNIKQDEPVIKAEDSVNIYGVNISKEAYKKALYNPDTEEYFWTDKQGQLHSYSAYLPAKIHPDGTVKYYHHGLLHNENGAAICNIHDRNSSEHFIMGRKVSVDELVHYIPHKNQIEFRKNGLLHREGAPAVIKFSDGACEEFYYTNGKPEDGKYIIERETAPSKSEIIDDELRELLLKQVLELEEEENMSVEKIKRSELEFSGGRLSQVWEGSKFGAKKGAVNGSTKLIASKVASYTPFEDSEWAQEFVRLIMIAGTAELVDIIPESAAEKAGLEEDTQREVAAFFRKVAGENMGRDIVKVAAGLIPYFKDIIMNFTAEDINMATHSYENELESAKQHIDLEELVKSQEENEVDFSHFEEEEEVVENA